MAAAVEIKGSRQESDDGMYTYGLMIFAYAGHSDTGLPVVGTTFYTPMTAASTPESGITGRRCVKVDKTQDKLPGLFICEAQFRAPKAYAIQTT